MKRRADVSPACFSDVRSHVVTPMPEGYFRVISGRSGKEYKVIPSGSCDCNGFKNRLTCTHLDAVKVFAAKVLEELRKT